MLTRKTKESAAKKNKHVVLTKHKFSTAWWSTIKTFKDGQIRHMSIDVNEEGKKKGPDGRFFCFIRFVIRKSRALSNILHKLHIPVTAELMR